MKVPRMDTFALPVSPSHVATTAGMALAAALPGLSGETRSLLIGGITGAYVIGESLYSSIAGRRVRVAAPLADVAHEELEILKRRITELEKMP